MSFWGVGPTVLLWAWPVLTLFGVAQVAAVRLVRKLGAPKLRWTIAVVIAALSALAVLGVVSNQSETEWAVREGFQPRSGWARTVEIVRVSTGPTLWAFVLGQLALLVRPLSVWAESFLAVVAGTALSWAFAIWLGLQPLPQGLFEIPGAFGAISSLGFVLSAGIWAASVRLRSVDLSESTAA